MFYTMGEVSEMFDVSSSLIRYWEKHFSIIKPVRNKKGNRLFTPKDVENFKLIYHLVKERGMTLEGAKKSLKGGKIEVNKEVELMERLLNMRSLLLEVREALKEEGDDTIEDDYVTPLNFDVEPDMSVAQPEITVADESSVAPRQSKSGEVSAEKELFAFYEQNLF